MKLVAALAVIAGLTLASVAAAATYRISDSPANSFTYSGGLSGVVVTAAIEGTFSITYQQGSPPILSSLNLFLVHASSDTSLFPVDLADFEGKPIQDFMSHDLQGAPAFGLTEGWSMHFAVPQPPPLDTISDELYSGMRVYGDVSTTVDLYSRLVRGNGLDGPSVHFLPLAATLIPEPATLGLAMASSLGLAATLFRRRK